MLHESAYFPSGFQSKQTTTESLTESLFVNMHSFVSQGSDFSLFTRDISYAQSLVAGPQPSTPVLTIQDVEDWYGRKTKRSKSSQSPALAMMTTGKIMTLASHLADAVPAVTCGDQTGITKPL